MVDHTSTYLHFENKKEGVIFNPANLERFYEHDEKKVIENALIVIKKNEPKTFRHDLLHQHNMCCGGTIDIYIEPVMKKNILYIFGAGHTGQAARGEQTAHCLCPATT